MESRRHVGDRTAFGLGLGLAMGLLAYWFAPILACGSNCIADPVAMRAGGLGNLELADVQLNAWILSWVQHSLLTNPSGLFDPNIFYPAERVLVQSEHMVSVAFALLPLRLFTDDALTLHRIAVLSSSLALFATTFGLVRFGSGSNLAGTIAGLVTMAMPWRFTELTHVQLLGVHLFPVIWWGLVRCTEPNVGKFPPIILAIALIYQLLASFYLAYFLLMTCAAVTLALAVLGRIDRPSAMRIALAVTPGAIALLAFALPYLEWSRGPGFQAGAIVDTTLNSLDVLRLTAPGTPWEALRYPFETTYQIPFAVLALACVAAISAVRQAAPVRLKVLVLGLGLACLGGFILELGRFLEIGSLRIPLPAALAAKWIPGFDQLRGPLRWAIPIGVAMPVLAGFGLDSLIRGSRAKRATGFAAMALLAIELVVPPLPAVDLWQGREDHRDSYAALASQAAGPVVVLPWPLQAMRDLSASSRYVLGSTEHWQPLLNGYSGYFPPGYSLLRRVAQELPDAKGLARMQDLSGLRWILVHEDELARGEARKWADATSEGHLRAVSRHGRSVLYEVPNWTPGGRYASALARPDLREHTLAGHERSALSPPDRRGSFSLSQPGPIRFAGVPVPAPTPLSLRIRNSGTRTWAGLDPDPNGLVAVQATFWDQAEAIHSETVPLTVDISAGEEVTVSLRFFPPAREGRFRLRLELVQRNAADTLRLDVPPIDRVARVLDVRARLNSRGPAPAKQ